MQLVNEKTQLRDIVIQRCLKRGDFTLASGKKSSFYLDCRLASLSSEGACLSARLMYQYLADVDAVGGPTLGADPFIGAILYHAHTQGRALPGFIVRKEAKGHGTGKIIEGSLAEGMTVALVEDVITTGGSVIKATKAVEDAGCTVKKVICLVNRFEGPIPAFVEKSIELVSLFDIGELL